MNVKLTAKQTAALMTAAYNPHARGDDMGAYVIHTMHHITRKSLHDKGLMYGHYYLTRKGTEVLATLSGNEVDMYGMEWAGSEGEEYITPVTPAVPSVEIQGEHVEHADAFGHMAEQTAWMYQEGVCVGLCAIGTGCAHCDEQYGPNDSQNGSESTSEETEEMASTIEVVAVVQNTPGMAGMTHYHSPGCRDIERECKRYGQTKADTYTLTVSSVADIVSDFEDGGRGSDHAEEYSAEWWTVVVENSQGDGLKIMSCVRDSLPAGKTTQGAPILMSGGYLKGIGDIPNAPEKEKSDAEISIERAAEKFPIGSHVSVKDGEPRKRVGAISGYVSDHTYVTHRSANDTRPWYIPAVVVERGDGSKRVILVGDLEFYSDASLIPGTSTGTTHHTMDESGKSWERFEHVLSVGDIVRSTETGRKLYEVYALIPGLPVVYVDPCDGSEPFPMGATKLYAL